MRAYELCERVPEVELKAPVLYGIGAFQTMKGDMRAGHAAFEKLIAEAKSCAAAAPAAVHALGAHLVQLQPRAVCHRDRACARDARAVRRRSLSRRALVGGRSESHRRMLPRRLARGRSDSPIRRVPRANRCVRHARELNESYSLAYTLNFAGLLVPDLRGEYALVLERADEGFQLARDLGYPFMEVFGTLWKAWAIGECGDTTEALALFDDALEKCRALGVQYHYGQLLARRARLLLASGQTRSGAGLRARSAGLRRALGRALDRGRCLSDAGRHLPGRRTCARGARRSVLSEGASTPHTTSSPGRGSCARRLRSPRSGASRAHARKPRSLLAPVYAWFTEGKETADLKRAARC